MILCVDETWSGCLWVFSSFIGSSHVRHNKLFLLLELLSLPLSFSFFFLLVYPHPYRHEKRFLLLPLTKRVILASRQSLSQSVTEAHQPTNLRLRGGVQQLSTTQLFSTQIETQVKSATDTIWPSLFTFHFPSLPSQFFSHLTLFTLVTSTVFT